VIEFKLPELGENIEQGDLVRLMIAPGATVSEGQAVMELETDKAVVEVPSSVSGTVKDIRVKEGDKIKVGQVIFTVDNGAGSSVASTQPARQPSDGSSTAAAAAAAPQPRTAEPAGTTPTPAPPAQATKISPSPSVREFKLPELGENISQGDLVRLMIAPGTNVAEGQPVMELETEKAVVEVPSSVTGVVKGLVSAGRISS
jgi:pyruvate dehydrogenase E2 component (dihydrolipoamide acetyltransferase)